MTITATHAYSINMDTLFASSEVTAWETQN
jgi:hypothetical protein